MLELEDRIKEFIDSGAQPVTAEEIQSSIGTHSIGAGRITSPFLPRINRYTVGIVALVAALVVLGILFVPIGSLKDGGSGSSGTPAGQATAPVTTPAQVARQEAIEAAREAAQHAAAAMAQAQFGGGSSCSARHLVGSVVFNATGTDLGAIKLTNQASKTCWMIGRPTVMVVDKGGHSLTQPDTVFARAGLPPPTGTVPFVLLSAAKASPQAIVEMDWTQCSPVSSDIKFRITFPNWTSPLKITASDIRPRGFKPAGCANSGLRPLFAIDDVRSVGRNGIVSSTESVDTPATSPQQFAQQQQQLAQQNALQALKAAVASANALAANGGRTTCAPRQLKGVVVLNGTRTDLGSITLTNEGSQQCSMLGRPIVTILDKAGRQLTRKETAYERAGLPPPTAGAPLVT
jgi:hypothetical protein